MYIIHGWLILSRFQASEVTDLNLEHITTGDEAVHFFAEHEGQARVKFFYCNLAICGIAEYKPYDLVVCQREEVNDEYFTISNSGVVHIEPGLGKQNSKFKIKKKIVGFF